MTANPFIYFGGDSFMAGDELADDTLQCWKDIYGCWEDMYRVYQASSEKFQTEFSQAKMNEARGWSDSQKEEYQRCQRDRHWSTIVCDKHGIKHHNDGLGGSSQESVLHRAIISFDKFEQEGVRPNLAIIQLTDPSRITVFKDSIKTSIGDWARPFMEPRHAFDVSYVFKYAIKNPNVAIKQYALAHMDVESETGNIIRWLTTLAITNSFFKEKTGRYPIYLESFKIAVRRYIHMAENKELYVGLIKYVQEFCRIEVNIVNTPEYRSLIHQARLYTINSNIWDLGHDTHLMCPGGHHTPQTHVNFAQFIEPHLLQELNNG